MAVRIRPEHFQTIHYYFFSMGIFSLTNAFLFTEYTVYSYIFMMFYAAHSAISWYISWFLYVRVKDTFIIETGRYTVSHIGLTVISGGFAVFMWYMFGSFIDSIVASLLLVNFFVIFFGAMWYLITRMEVAKKLFDWQDRNMLNGARKLLLEFRKKNGLSLVDDSVIKGYKWGANPSIESLFSDLKTKSDAGDAERVVETVRKLETALSEFRISELEEKINTLEKGSMSATDANLVKAYRGLIQSYGKRMVDYERDFRKKAPVKNLK